VVSLAGDFVNRPHIKSTSDSILGDTLRLPMACHATVPLPCYVDGGGSAEPKEHIDAWLVSDERSELQQEIRKQALARGLEPLVSRYERCGLRVEPRSVVHTSHPTFGYLITAHGRSVAWAPEFLEFPAWATARCRPKAQRLRVRRIVFAHIGRPTIRAMDRGERPSFGEFGREGQTYAP
jgi:hypothetical protein